MSLLRSSLDLFRRYPWLGFGSLFLTIGIVALLVATAQTVSETRYRRGAEAIRGVVVSKHIRPARKDSSTGYEVRYRFITRDGREVEGRRGVGLERWESLREHGPIDIEYLPSTPDSNRLAGEGGFAEPIVEILLGTGVFGTIGTLMFRKGYRRWRIEQRLMRVGVGVEATVTTVTT